MILQKNKLNDWLSALMKYSLYVPVKRNDVSMFAPIEKPEDVFLDECNTLRSPKAGIFPQTETMFKYGAGREKEVVALEPGQEKKVVFGIRPCDARGFSVLDHVFGGDFKDEFYLKNRENTTLVGLACNAPDINCFCTSMGGSPGGTEGLDVLLTDLGDKYYVETVTEKGKALVDESGALFTQSGDADASAKQDLKGKAEAAIKRKIQVEGIPAKLGTMFDSELWKERSMKCLGCGVCTYLCPTCHCFDVQDESRGYKGSRKRMWDSCMYGEYTIHTSGHNPRPTRMNRLRNRVYHKFKYYHDNYGVNLCVGCGRCVDNCPVNVDIIDIVDNLGGMPNE